MIHLVQRARPGMPAADFELPDVEGRIVRLGDFEGSWLLLIFHRHLE